MEEVIKKYAERVGYSDDELQRFSQSEHCTRLVRKLADAAPNYSIIAEVVHSKHCSSEYKVGDKFVMDVAGNLISKLCPKRICVYLVGQFQVPVALINERFSEGLDPNSFHFMHYVRCPDVGVECGGYGEVMVQIKVAPREKP
ncbi:MAG: hypothetical protein QW561_00290 [Candidatus Aenigmatarchaeota archaeon]